MYSGLLLVLCLLIKALHTLRLHLSLAFSGLTLISIFGHFGVLQAEFEIEVAFIRIPISLMLVRIQTI